MVVEKKTDARQCWEVKGVRSLADGWQIRMILQAFLAWDSIVAGEGE